MASDENNPVAEQGDWETIHAQAMEEYERDYERERHNINEAYEDLRFRRGELKDQWTPEALKAREGRPTHVLNELPQFIRQITGDMRQARPGIKVVPVDDVADPDVATKIGGIVRYIENRSYAQSVYTGAADSQVACGIGHWRVLTEYAAGTTFNQEIRIGAVDDSVAVIWDADSILPTREDAGHCFVPVDMSRAKFKSRWPEAKADGFEIKASSAFDNWHGDDFIRVAEYWLKKPIKLLLAQGPDGSIRNLTQETADLDSATAKQFTGLLEAQGYRVGKRDGFKVCRYLMTCAEILEEEDWPGQHIPIVPLIGEEVRIGREVYRHGVVRYGREPQRMVNYYASAETEVIALQPKAPWIGTEKQFKNHYDLWETANTKNHPFLMYTPDASAPPPQRVQPPVASEAIQLGGAQAAAKLRSVIGIYDASLGARSNETSGIAIRRRDAQADTGTFVYHANFALAIQRTGQIIVDLIPHIYDSERIVRIIGEDGKPDLAKINQKVLQDGQESRLNDVTVGSYDVMTVEGPSYATMRDEAREGLATFIQSLPAAAPVLGDIYAKMQNWPDADKIAERLQTLLPPAVKQQLKKDAPPEPPTPEEEAAAQEAEIKQRAVMIELEGKELQNQKTKVEIAQAANELQAGGVDQSAAIKAQAEMTKAASDRQMAELELVGKQQELDQKRRLGEIDIELKQMDLALKRMSIHQSGEKHQLGMVQQDQNIAHRDESHRANMERQQQPAQ